MERKYKHTEGPWNVVDRYSDAVTIVDKDGFEHITVEGMAVLLDYSRKIGVPHWADSAAASREVSMHEQRANAQLIATAPDLLEALENIIIGIGMGWELEGMVDVARAAIARATGASK